MTNRRTRNGSGTTTSLPGQTLSPMSSVLEAPAELEAPEPRKKRGRPASTKVVYPGLFTTGEDGVEDVKLTEIPNDWDAKLHQNFKGSDFIDETVFLEWKAQQYDVKAVDLRKQIDAIRSLGSVADRKNARRLMALTSRIAELQSQLEANGTDVGALLAKLQGSTEG